ncbi:MAG: hypothetical protein WC405_03820 [Syntrophales bacterium]
MSNAESLETNVQNQDREDKAAVAASVLNRKVRLVGDPMAIVLAPRSREGHLIVKIMFGFDRVVNSMRMKAGVSIPIDKVVESLRSTEEFTLRLDSLTRTLSELSSNSYGIGSYQYETPESRRLLAERRSSYVFVPRTEEGRKIALLIKRIDPLLIQCRTTCTDFTRAGEVITGVIGAFVDFNELTRQLAKTAKVDYGAPKGIITLVSAKGLNSPVSSAA